MNEAVGSISTATWTRKLARARVPLGFICGAIVLWLARPTPELLRVGLPIAALGEALRVWAAGHLEKSREVTQSGPYRWLRHPLYAGSTLLGIGLAIAASSLPVAIVTGLYLLLTISAAVRSEEAFLRKRFGGDYDAYRQGRGPAVARRFSFARAMRNKEYRAIVGVLVTSLLLVAKMWLTATPEP
jgi:protein-S-isoprenylcysteine O-methyltransferase Ste14